MTHSDRFSFAPSRVLAWFALVGALSAPLAAQDRPTPLSPVDDPQRELVELFGKVETRLREIDRLLTDAGAGDTSALAKVGPAGIDELLKKGQEESQATIRDIDKILELARQMQQQQQQQSGGSGSGQGQPQQQSGGDQPSPLDGRSQGDSQREATPSSPEQRGQDGQSDRPNGSKPENQPGSENRGKDGQKPGEDGKKPGEDGRKPNDANASRAEGQNRPDGSPSGGASGAPNAPSDGKDRWGDLPVHARDVFRNEGGRDMPVQYRDWIDAYYRRLNQKRP